mgnify:CR=1 FL=1
MFVTGFMLRIIVRLLTLLFTMDVLVRFTTLVEHNEKQNIEIVKIICKELGKPQSLITHVGDRKGHDMRYAIDPTKIHNELGWLPETKFEDGIKKTIKWYLENREWWENIISGEYQSYYEQMYGNRFEDIRNSVKGAI